MDHKMVGRVRMQTVGFICMFVLFLSAAVRYDTLLKPEYIHAFQAI